MPKGKCSHGPGETEVAPAVVDAGQQLSQCLGAPSHCARQLT
jgi:hypothetical protein